MIDIDEALAIERKFDEEIYKIAEILSYNNSYK